MKSTGIVRKVDELGRIVLPIEMRRTLDIAERDALEIYVEGSSVILKKYKPRCVVHCFSGSVETAREIINLGMMISFTGVLTFKNSKKAVEACKEIPIERLMLETDSPYMAPVPFRGKRNDSSLTHYVAEKVAEIKGMTVEEVINICNSNAASFFGFDNH